MGTFLSAPFDSCRFPPDSVCFRAGAAFSEKWKSRRNIRSSLKREHCTAGACMSVEAVREFLKEHGLESAYREFSSSSATVALAAAVLGCEEGRIAKTLSLMTKSGPIVIVVMGTARLDNRKFKEHFGEKAVFIKAEELEDAIGHPMGGCCPFALRPGVRVYLDASLRTFDPVYPAAGAPNNAAELTLAQLEEVTGGEWINVCKDSVCPEQ